MAGATYLDSRSGSFLCLVCFFATMSMFLSMPRPFDVLILILLRKQIQAMVTINLMKCLFREALDSALVADDGIRYTWEV